MTPAVASLSVAAKRPPQNKLPPIPTNSERAALTQAAVPTLATAGAGAAPPAARLKESGTSRTAPAATTFLVCATFRLQKPKIKKQPY